jgi:hypothetical protein
VWSLHTSAERHRRAPARPLPEGAPRGGAASPAAAPVRRRTRKTGSRSSKTGSQASLTTVTVGDSFKSPEGVPFGDHCTWTSAGRAGPACVVAPRISRAELCTETGRQRLRATLVEPGRCGRLPHRPCGRPCRGRPCECAPAIRRGSRRVEERQFRLWSRLQRRLFLALSRAAGTRETETRLTGDCEIGSSHAGLQ